MPASNHPRNEQRTEEARDWIFLHRGKATAAAIGLVALLAVAWFYKRSADVKQQRAESAYYDARGAAAQGNLALAQSELKKVVDRYAGTRGGTLAAMTLAQVLYEQGKYREGIAVLEGIGGKRPADLAPSVHVVMAAGYEEMRDYVRAAKQWAQAAEVARFPEERNGYRAAQASALTAGGRGAEALPIWRELAEEPSAVLAPEARVRIGELTAKPAG